FCADRTIFLLSSSARARAWIRTRSAEPFASCSRCARSFAPSARASWRIRSRSAAVARRISSASERPRERTSSITVSRPMTIALRSTHFAQQLEGDHQAEDDDRLRQHHQDQAPPEQLGLLGHRPDGRPSDDFLGPCGRYSCPCHRDRRGQRSEWVCHHVRLYLLRRSHPKGTERSPVALVELDEGLHVVQPEGLNSC